MFLTLIRHGETTGRPFVFRGRSDPPLSQTGWAQLNAAFAALESHDAAALLTSPLRRCADFTLEWSRTRNIGSNIVDAFREIDFGDWEELAPSEAQARDPGCYEHFLRDTVNWCSPGGESYRAFRDRVLAGAALLSSNPSQHTIVLTHAGVMRVLLAQVLGIGPREALRVHLPYGASCKLWYEGNDSRLLSLHQVAA